MKIAFLIGCSTEADEIKKHLSQHGYTPLVTSSYEEIGQTGVQLGRVVVCFSDPSASYKFLKEAKWRDFKVLNLLFLRGTPKMTEDASKKIKEVSLNLIIKYDETTLKALLTKFESDTETPEELEFMYDPGSSDEAA